MKVATRAIATTISKIFMSMGLYINIRESSKNASPASGRT
jgi:hypothetical protein